MRKSIFMAALAAGTLATSFASAQLTTVFEENFNGYADNAAVAAGQWNASLLPGINDDESVNGAQSMAHFGIDGANQRITSAFPGGGVDTSETPLTVSYAFYDGNGASFSGAPYTAGANGRAGLAVGRGAADYMFIGAYHTAPGNTTHYVARVMGGGNGWQPTTAPRTVGWQEFTFVMDNGDIDFFHNGGATPVLTDTYTTMSGWGDWVGLGSPAGGPYVDAYYDDILAQTGTEASGGPALGDYTWTGATDSDWATASNWDPARTAPEATDVLVFDTAATVTGVPSETLGGLILTDGVEVTLAAAAANDTLTLDGGADVLQIPSDSALIISSQVPMQLAVASGSTATIDGTVRLTTPDPGNSIAHKLTSGDVHGIQFADGAVFEFAPGGTGGGFPFSEGEQVRFLSGSTAYQGGTAAGGIGLGSGSNMLGGTVAEPQAQFDVGSTLYNYWSLNLVAAGRSISGTYVADNRSGASLFVGSGSTLSTLGGFVVPSTSTNTVFTGAGGSGATPDYLIVTGDFIIEPGTDFNDNYNGTNGVNNLRVAGNLLFDGGTISTNDRNYVLDGASGDQNLSLVSTTSFPELTVNKADGDVVLVSDVAVRNVLRLTSGNIVTNGNALILNAGATVDDAGGYVVGTVARVIDASATGASTIPVYDAAGDRYDVTVDITSAGSGTGTVSVSLADSSANAGADDIAQVWTIESDDISGFAATLTVTYDPAAIAGGVNEADLKLARWNGSAWEVFLNSVIDTTANTVTLDGVTAFSEWTLIEDAATNVNDWMILND